MGREMSASLVSPKPITLTTDPQSARDSHNESRYQYSTTDVQWCKCPGTGRYVEAIIYIGQPPFGLCLTFSMLFVPSINALFLFKCLQMTINNSKKSK